MNACDVIGYTYDADYHCTACAIDRYGEHPNSPPIHRWADTKGAEDACPIFADAEWWERDDPRPQELRCGTCGDIIAHTYSDALRIIDTARETGAIIADLQASGRTDDALRTGNAAHELALMFHGLSDGDTARALIALAEGALDHANASA